MDEAIWDHSTFTKNRERLIEAKVARKLLAPGGAPGATGAGCCRTSFSVDGTLIESWAAVKSMRRRDGRDEPPGPGRNPPVDFHGERRTKRRTCRRTIPRRSSTARHNAHGQALLHGACADGAPHGPAVDVEVTEANGFAEREAALTCSIVCRRRRRTLAADKAYDTTDFVAACGRAGYPHSPATTPARRLGARWAHHAHAGYRASQRLRKRIEEGFGWGKDGRPLRKMKVGGLAQVSFLATLTVSCYALLRVARLTAPPPLVST